MHIHPAGLLYLLVVGLLVPYAAVRSAQRMATLDRPLALLLAWAPIGWRTHPARDRERLAAILPGTPAQVALTGSLLAAMLVHFLYDLFVGFLFRELARREAAAARATA